MAAQATAKRVIFFDQCTPVLDTCHNGCARNEMTLCKHRLKYDAEVWKSDLRMGFLGYSDQQVILYFLFLIKQQFKQGNWDDTDFIIVTRDSAFLKDAQAEHEKRRKNWKKPRLRFQDDSVAAEGARIHVLTVDCQPCINRKQRELRCVIEDLNRKLTKLDRRRNKRR